MSAIWGFVDLGSEESKISSMEDEFKRKCKLDSIFEKHYKCTLFGHGQQLITPEDAYETMPYISEDDEIILASDCIIDDREKLLEELNVSSEEKISNGRLLFLAYKKWHFELAKHIKGIFSIAIYDGKSKELFLCTDKTSSRCLYFYKTGNQCVFSTLISPIRKLYPDIEKNEMYLKDFLLIPGLMPNISSNETPWKDVFMIEAGSYILVSKEGAKVVRYWEPEKISVAGDMEGLKKQFIETYRKAVSRVIRTDGRIGMALSGGFDSSSVAALAAPLLAKQGKEIISYTYVPHIDMSSEFDKRFITNESELVKKIQTMYPNIETNFVDNEGKSFWEYLDELLDVMEIPFKAFVNLPQLLEIYRSANNRGCKIFLNGQTGNASVSYGKIENAVYELIRKKKYLSAFRHFNNFCKLARISRKRAYLMMLKMLSDNKDSGRQENFTKDMINPFLNEKLLEGYDLAKRNKSGMVMYFDEHILKREEFKYELYTLPALSYIGAMETKLGLYTGTVIRDATRDPDVLNFCYSIPFEYFCYEGTPRYLVRGFMKDYLPNDVLYPIDKTGVQGSDWIYRLQNIRNTVKNGLCELLEKDELKEYFNLEEINRFINSNALFSKDSENLNSELLIAALFVKFTKN